MCGRCQKCNLIFFDSESISILRADFMRLKSRQQIFMGSDIGVDVRGWGTVFKKDSGSEYSYF